MKSFIDSELGLARAQRNRVLIQRVLNAAMQDYAKKIGDAGRSQIAQNQVTRQGILIDQQSRRERIARIQQQARLLAQQNQLTRAEETLTRLMRLGNLSRNERLRVQQQLVQIGAIRTRQDAQEQNSLVRLTIAQARAARAARDHAAALSLLNSRLAAGGLSTLNRARLTEALAIEQRFANAAAPPPSSRGGVASFFFGGDGGRRSGFGQIVDGFGRALSLITKLTASAVLFGFVIRTIARGFDRIFLDPLRRTLDSAVKITDEFRRMQIAISGITGSMNSARNVIRDVRTATEGLPVTTLEALQGIRGLAFTPATARVIQNPEGRVENFNRILSILSGLATIDPEQGIKGAQFAVREALAGEFRSLRFRFEISPTVVAASIGKTLEDLKADPSLVIPALERFVNTFIGPETIAEFSNLLSVQGNLIRGQLQEFFDLIGESGIYDSLVARAKQINTALKQTVGSDDPVSRAAARDISTELDRLVYVFVESVERLIEGVTGQRVDLQNFSKQTVQDLTLAFRSFIRELGDWTATLIVFGTQLATSLAKALAYIGGFDIGPISRSSIESRLSDASRELTNRQDLQNLFRVDIDRLERERERAVSDIPRLYDRDNWLDARRQIESYYHKQLQKRRMELRRAQFDFPTEELQKEVAQLENLLRIYEDFDAIFAERPSDRLKGAIDNFGEMSKELQQFFNSIGFESEAALEEAMLITNQFGTSTEGARRLREGFGTFRERMSEIQQTIFDQFERSTLEGLESRLVAEIEALDAGLGNANDVARLRTGIDLIKRIRDIESFQRATTGGLLGNQARVLLNRAPASLKDFPAELGIRNILSLFDSLRALAEAGDLRQITSSSAAAAATGFGGLQAGRGRFGGGALSLLRILGQIPDGVTANALPGVGDTRALIEMTDQTEAFINKLRELGLITDDTGQSIRDSLIGTLKVLRQQFQEALTEQEFNQLFDPSGVAGLFDASFAENLRLQIGLVDEQLSELEKKVNETLLEIQKMARETAEGMSQAFRSGFVDSTIAVIQGATDEIGDILNNMFTAIQRQILDLIFELTLIRGVVNRILNPAFGLAGTDLELPTNTFSGQKSGNAFDRQRIRPMASGGFIRQPTVFPQSGVQLGEDGTEVVVPVGRTRSGRAGIVMDQGEFGGGGGGGWGDFHLHVHGVTDAGSFRKSKHQVFRDARKALDRTARR